MLRKGTLLLMLLTVAGGVAAGLEATPVWAQSSDVQVDPNSPAGTQYDIPVRRARREAQGKDAKDNQDNPSLFGEGVTPDSSSSSDSTEPKTGAKKATSKDS